MNQKPYFESVRDVYVSAAAELYKLAVGADFETADPVQFLAQGNEMRNRALETWTLTSRQESRLAGLKARAELNTTEGQAHKQRILDKLKEV